MPVLSPKASAERIEKRIAPKNETVLVMGGLVAYEPGKSISVTDSHQKVVKCSVTSSTRIEGKMSKIGWWVTLVYNKSVLVDGLPLAERIEFKEPKSR